MKTTIAWEFKSAAFRGGTDATDDQIFWFTGPRDRVWALASRLKLHHTGEEIHYYPSEAASCGVDAVVL